MLVEMERQEFESLSHTELFLRCTEPTIVQLRRSDLSEKTQLVSQLNSGQQAMVMFRLLYPAQNSADEYYYWISYLIKEPSYWTGVIGGLRFFGEDSLIELLEETGMVLNAQNKESRLIDNTELLKRVPPLFSRFQSMLPVSIERISGYIRSNSETFVQLIH
ncbi:hypothetical protein [Paenibacillus sp. UNC451MF]|uniref:hypothetical protein n=1 Tax=Paenibacillus sp. UNC451MF TaxID=1449063 RepID=UPI00048AD7F0|nr:hypothetical protein [Paenibacillus sp. UNC451MF]